MTNIIHKTVQVSVTLSQSWSNVLAVSLPLLNEQITTNFYFQGLLLLFHVTRKAFKLSMQLCLIEGEEKGKTKLININCPAFNMNSLLQLPITRKQEIL